MTHSSQCSCHIDHFSEETGAIRSRVDAVLKRDHAAPGKPGVQAQPQNLAHMAHHSLLVGIHSSRLFPAGKMAPTIRLHTTRNCARSSRNAAHDEGAEDMGWRTRQQLRLTAPISGKVRAVAWSVPGPIPNLVRTIEGSYTLTLNGHVSETK
jgi:hypothetical protein